MLADVCSVLAWPGLVFSGALSCGQLLERKDLLFGETLSLQAGGSQYAGSIVDYEHGLSFATVHGSGHMVPTFMPSASLQMIERFLGYQPY